MLIELHWYGPGQTIIVARPEGDVSLQEMRDVFIDCDPGAGGLTASRRCRCTRRRRSEAGRTLA